MRKTKKLQPCLKRKRQSMRNYNHSSSSSPSFSTVSNNTTTTGKRKKRVTFSGGNLNVAAAVVPQDVTTFASQVQHGVSSFINTIRGVSSTVDPLPWKDQYT